MHCSDHHCPQGSAARYEGDGPRVRDQSWSPNSGISLGRLYNLPELSFPSLYGGNYNHLIYLTSLLYRLNEIKLSQGSMSEIFKVDYYYMWATKMLTQKREKGVCACVCTYVCTCTHMHA